MAIRGYLGNLPAQCGICLEDESRARTLIETTCCRANTVATEVIPKTYHRDCLKKWAKTRAGDSFLCLNCQRVLPKSSLFSKADIIKQYFDKKFIKIGLVLGMSYGMIIGLYGRLGVKKEHLLFETLAWSLPVIRVIEGHLKLVMQMIKTQRQITSKTNLIAYSFFNAVFPAVAGFLFVSKALTSWTFFQKTSNFNSIFCINHSMRFIKFAFRCF